MKVVAFVPIKMNSQRLPHKNILPISGHPMCWHILNTLTQVEHINEIYVYCSDSTITEYIPQGVKVLLRNKSLDGDLVKGFEIYESFINEIDADVYILAHATSPFMKVESIQNSINKVLFSNYDSSFSASKIKTFAWYDGSPINYDLNDVPRTQDLKPIFLETSGFFIFKKEIFKNYRRRIGFNPYIQELDNIESLDIDTQDDYNMALLFEKFIMEAK